MHQKPFNKRNVSALETFPYQKHSCIRNSSILETFPHQKPFRIRNSSALETVQHQKFFHIRNISAFPHQKQLRMRNISVLETFLQQKHFQIRNISTLEPVQHQKILLETLSHQKHFALEMPGCNPVLMVCSIFSPEIVWLPRHSFIVGDFYNNKRVSFADNHSVKDQNLKRTIICQKRKIDTHSSREDVKRAVGSGMTRMLSALRHGAILMSVENKGQGQEQERCETLVLSTLQSLGEKIGEFGKL